MGMHHEAVRIFKINNDNFKINFKENNNSEEEIKTNLIVCANCKKTLMYEKLSINEFINSKYSKSKSKYFYKDSFKIYPCDYCK